jgi:hypothetical protein
MPIIDITDKEGFINWFKKTYRNKIAYYDGDPQKGGKRITMHEHFDSMGIKFTPTGDYERLKIVREESYRHTLQEVIERRKWNAGIETSESDIKEFRQLWLADELEHIKGWEESNQERPENLLELKKYTRYINIELETLEIHQQWKPLPNLNEYLLRLNRLLTEIPNKLVRLFPLINILPKKQWDETARLKPEEYLAATHRYIKLGFSNDTSLLENIRLDPDFMFFLKDKNTDPQRITEQFDNIQNTLDYLRMCQVYTSDFDINKADEDKVVFWTVTSGIADIMDWLDSLSILLHSCLPKIAPAPALSTPLYSDDQGNFSIEKTSNYRETNIWLINRLHLALVSADDTMVRWMDTFMSDLNAEPDRAEKVFHRHRDYYLEQRQQYIRYNNLFSEFFEKQGGFSESMLQTLTNRVQTMYLNSTHTLMPETLVERVYANNFMINRLNAWRTETSPLTSTPTANDKRPNAFNKHMPLDEVRKWFIQLAESNSKNGNPFLTVEQVEQFIERAFVGIPFTEKLSMNEKPGDKRNVVGLFHLFYTHCMTHKHKTGKIDPSATAKKYILLLTDYFSNWTFDEVKDNFRQAGNWKKPT